MSKTQQSLETYTAGTTTESITRTVRLKLETSQRKNQRVRNVIDEWQSMVRHLADILPGVPEYQWSRNNTTLYRLLGREFPDHDILAATRQEAVAEVTQAYQSWAARGKQGERPRGTYGEGDYVSLRQDSIMVANNERGYGVRLSLEPRDPEWFHITGGEYQQQYLERLVEGDVSNGSGELHLHDNGSLYLHLTVREDVEVYVPEDVGTYIGVDIGENVIYAAAAVTHGTVDGVEMQSGSEFRHHRDRLEEKKDALQQKGNLRGVKKIRGERERYTNHVTHEASREIVRFAEEHAPCAIRLEEMGDYRETAEDPIHDWPRGMLQEKVAYKATEKGIPVEMVSPRNTSVTCRECGQATREARNGSEFHCRRCDYEVHADVNAAINIANDITG